MTTMTSSAGLVSPTTRRVCLVLAATGAVMFLYGITAGDRIRAWQSLLVNFLFFGGLAHAGIVLAAIFQATSARWGRPLKRLAEATVAFLPVAAVLLVVLLAGTSTWATWVHEPIEAKTPWLNVPFFVTRQVLAFVLLSGLSVLFVYRSLRPDIGMLDESGERRATGLAARIIAGWRGVVPERADGQRGQDRLAPGVIIAYAWVFSLVAFDLVMSLEPHWFSTLMGAYYFVGNLFMGIAFLALVGVQGRGRLGLGSHVGPHQMHDIGKLLFGFSVLWAYMVWSQYLVIWYGDIPEETEFIYHRMHGAWAPVTWTVITLAFTIPFAVLLSRAVKTHAKGLTTIALVALTGMWLERFLLVSPSLWSDHGVPFGLMEIVVTAGVGGAFVYCYSWFLETFPVLPVSDPRLTSVTEHWLPEPVSGDAAHP